MKKHINFHVRDIAAYRHVLTQYLPNYMVKQNNSLI